MFKTNIRLETLNNTFWRKEIYTNSEQQVVVMNLPRNSDIGMERHNGSQLFIIEEGSGRAYIGKNCDKMVKLSPGSMFVVDRNKFHNIIAGSRGMKLLTIYSPPQHKKGTRESERDV